MTSKDEKDLKDVLLQELTAIKDSKAAQDKATHAVTELHFTHMPLKHVKEMHDAPSAEMAHILSELLKQTDKKENQWTSITRRRAEAILCRRCH